jgi:hypothetical protein
VDVSERSFVLVFDVPIEDANLATSDDLSQAARMAHDQKADWYGNSLEELRKNNATMGAAVSSDGGSGPSGDRVKLSVDVVCDNLWTFEMLLSGFALIKAHYGDLVNSPHMGKLKDIGAPREHEGAYVARL